MTVSYTVTPLHQLHLKDLTPFHFTFDLESTTQHSLRELSCRNTVTNTKIQHKRFAALGLRCSACVKQKWNAMKRKEIINITLTLTFIQLALFAVYKDQFTKGNAMNFEVTTHESIPQAPRNKTGLTSVFRSLKVNQSVHIPADGKPGQRSRIACLCNQIGTGLFSIRIRDDRSFDIYRVKEWPQTHSNRFTSQPAPLNFTFPDAWHSFESLLEYAASGRRSTSSRRSHPGTAA